MFSSLGLIYWRALAILSLLLIGLPYVSHAHGAQMSGPTDPKELETFLDNFFAKQMAPLHIPSAVFVLVKDGKVFFAKGYGYADLEKKTPVIPEKTLFRVGSISKLFTATAVMQLYEKGLLSLDDDVNKYLKTFQLKDNYPRPVTFANLLTHTAGFDEQSIGMVARNESEVVPFTRLARFLAGLNQAGRESEPKALSPTLGSGDFCLITALPLERVMAHLRSCGVEIVEGPVRKTGAM